MGGRRWLGALGWRLLAAFLTVAVSAVAVLAVIAALSVDRRSATLAREQRDQLRRDIAGALAAAYSAGQGSWSALGLSALSEFAREHGLQITVVDAHDQVVGRVGVAVGDGAAPTHEAPPPAGTQQPDHDLPGRPATGTAPHVPAHPSTRPAPRPATRPAPRSATREPSHDGGQGPHPSTAAGGEGSRVAALAGIRFAAPAPTAAAAPAPTAVPAQGATTTIPIVVGGRRVGSARFTFPAADPAPVDAARTALLRQLALGAGVAVLVAIAASAFVARRVSRPVVALTDATREFAAGRPVPETTPDGAPGELGELARAFRDMAATVHRQEQMRRAVVADVAHELRTPVTILRGQTEQLLDGIAEPTTERIVSLHDEVLRLGRLTDDLAALASADAAGLALRSRPLDLAELTRRTAAAMRAQFDGAELHLVVDAADPVPLDGDEGRLAQVLTNLLTNAAKFTPPGGTVTVGTTRRGAEAVLSVADTGPGISEDELPHVFERFWRGRAAGSRAGTGVGLAVVAALVDAHRGTVTATGAPGGGARFVVRLPADGAPAPGATARR